MKAKRRLPKALEAQARAIKNSDEFIVHVASITNRYRREHRLNAGENVRAMRVSLKQLQRHAAALRHWLQEADPAKSNTLENAALNKINSVLYAAPGLARVESDSVLRWLTLVEKGAQQCLVTNKSKTSNASDVVPATRTAAQALQAIWEHHKLKWSTSVSKKKQSDAVQLLLAIAHGAGDKELTVQAAQRALRQINLKSD
jgi:cell fate (sporulation/competence/biofilm development) regulator YmcA (YheA/YmcA/DUF963 family)